MYAYGIRGALLKWFEGYLTGRTQYVAFNGTNLDIHNVKCGVPQCSILEPLLFNVELILMSAWLNPTNYLSYTKKNHHRARLKTANCNDLVIDNASITRINSAKYLGITIDVIFDWIEHIIYTCIKNKISKVIGIMYKAIQYLNKSSLVNLYYSYVYPYLTYCIEV